MHQSTAGMPQPATEEGGGRAVSGQQLWPRRDCLAHVVVGDAERSKARVQGALQLPARAGAGTQAKYAPFTHRLL